MRLVIEKRAAKRLADLPPKARAALLERLKAIAAEPFGDHPQVTAIKGERDAFRLRQGDWRAVYKIDRAAQSMHVRLIEPRSGRTYR